MRLVTPIIQRVLDVNFRRNQEIEVVLSGT